MGGPIPPDAEGDVADGLHKWRVELHQFADGIDGARVTAQATRSHIAEALRAFTHDGEDYVGDNVTVPPAGADGSRQIVIVVSSTMAVTLVDLLNRLKTSAITEITSRAFDGGNFTEITVRVTTRPS